MGYMDLVPSTYVLADWLQSPSIPAQPVGRLEISSNRLTGLLTHLSYSEQSPLATGPLSFTTRSKKVIEYTERSVSQIPNSAIKERLSAMRAGGDNVSRESQGILPWKRD